MRGQRIIHKKELVKLLKKYHTQAEVARYLGVTRAAVQQAIKRFSIPFNRSKAIKAYNKQVNKDRNSKIINLVKKGYEYIDIAKRLNISYNMVSVVARRHGISVPYYAKKRYKKAYELYCMGWALADISRNTDLTVQQIIQTLRMHYFKDKLKRGEHRRGQW